MTVQLWKLLGNYLKKSSTLVDNQRWTGANGRGGGVTGAGGRTVLCRPPSESRATALEGVEERFMKKRENDFSNLHQFYSYLVYKRKKNWENLEAAPRMTHNILLLPSSM